MIVKENSNKKYHYSYSIDDNGQAITVERVVSSFSHGFIDNVERNGTKGLRKPQYGALCAIRAYWTLGSEPITAVLPTGTGKSETMLAAIISERIKRTLIVVPTKMLRDQIYSRAKTWGILKDLGCINDSVIYPNILCIESNFQDINKLKELVEKSNIIVATMNLLNRMSGDHIDVLVSNCDLLIVDEAHHIASKTWETFKGYFSQKKILQFTATPYRQDGKLVDGKIIYNFPMHMAINEGYFQPIKFIPVEEYDESMVDCTIAKKAIAVLKDDLHKGYNHILLVRVNEVERAQKLYDDIYSKYQDLKPVILTNKVGARDRKDRLAQVKACISRIVVCVDMFGEGIDIPNLKIAALHDKFKSLPITLQFIGRFARTQQNLGAAKVIANITDINIMDSLYDLYEKDADWNQLLPIKSEEQIQDRISLQELIAGFDKTQCDIDLKQIRPKVSMKAYTYTGKMEWTPEAWSDVFDGFNCYHYVNRKEKILIIVEPISSSQGWTTQKNIESLNWNFYVIYWNSEKKYICINASDHQKGKLLLKNIFTDDLFVVNQEKVFRCLANIKRLVLASVGLKSAIDGPVRYKMFAGIDVAEGISTSNKANCYKSNIFGAGYEGEGRISIGCSYKGKIWSRWVENIAFWKNWCDRVMEKILDPTNDSKILDNILIPTVVNEVIKDKVAYRVDFDESILYSMSRVQILTFVDNYGIEECELQIGSCEEDKQFFKFVCPSGEYTYYLQIKGDVYHFSFYDKDKAEPEIIIGKHSPIKLSDYFDDNPPLIWYVGSSSLQGNVLLKAYTEKEHTFSDQNLISWDWKTLNVDIRVESQLADDGTKLKNSIQYATIQNLKTTNKYKVIFDDDGSGEIADVVAIRELANKIIIELYHCKFSMKGKPGARVKDLYEVCGQAEKSVFWKSDGIQLIERMKYREGKRLSTGKVSRFELGNMDELNIIQKKMLNKPITLEIFLVQPGVDSNQLSEDMRVILGGATDYCQDTFSVPVKLICS